MYSDKMKNKSIHLSPWPPLREERINQEIEKDGDLIMTVIGDIRRDKAERKKPLNAPIKKLTIHSGSKKNARILSQASEDIAGTCKTERIEIEPVSRKGKEVQGYPEIQFSAEY